MAKFFTVSKKFGLIPYIYSSSKLLSIGEKGRGREESLVNFPTPDKKISEGWALCSVIDGKEKCHTLELLNEGEEPGKTAIVLIMDQSGFRGSWKLLGKFAGKCEHKIPVNSSQAQLGFDLWLRDNPSPRHGDYTKLPISFSEDADNDEYIEWFLWKRDTIEKFCLFFELNSFNSVPSIKEDRVESTRSLIEFENWALEKSRENQVCKFCKNREDRLMFLDKPKILAEGYCAQGDAGRMGGGAEYLIALQPGEGFSVHRSGRLYGESDLICFSWDGESVSKKVRSEIELELSSKECEAVKF